MIGMSVVGATLVATGERIIPRSLLHSDGFEVKDAEVPERVPDDLKDCSTTGEVVQCIHCKRLFPLADLAIEE